jgi:chromosome segregation ATPase
LIKKNQIIDSLENKNNDEDLNIQVLNNRYNKIIKDFENKEKELNDLKKSQKIQKYNELMIQNKLLTEHSNKLNNLYLNAQEKLIQYETSIKELIKLKENVSKQDFMILNFQENYSKVQKELISKNKEIQKLMKNINEKQDTISVLNKKLEYQYQLNERLLEETENINKTKQYVEMKKDLETKLSYAKNDSIFYKDEVEKKNKALKEMKEKLYLIEPKRLNKGNLMSQIYELKNKLSNEKEKNRKLNEKIKNLEKMRYNNPRYGEEDYHKNNLNQKYNFKKSSNKSTIEEEDEDCDIMSDYSLNEFIYILTKCFEAKFIDLTTIESKIFTNETFNLFNPKENYRNFILKIASNLCLLLNM